VQDGVGHLELRGSCEGRFPRQQLKEGHAESVQIGRGSRLLAPELLRRHVGWRPHRGQRPGQVASIRQPPGQPEISKEDSPITGHEQIRGFDVAVDHSFAVEVRQAFQNLAGEVQHTIDAQGPFFGENPGQAAPGDPLHDRHR